MSNPVLGPETLKVLKGPIYHVWQQIGPDIHVWQQIGPDAMEFAECNEEAVEMCIDADRLIVHGGFYKEQEYLMRILDCYDYRKVLKYLSDNIPLI